MHAKYLSLAAMTVLLGAQAIAIPLPLEQTGNGAVIKAPADVRDRMLGINKDKVKDIINDIKDDIPQDVKDLPKDIKNKVPQDIKDLPKDIINKIPQDIKDKVPQEIKNTISKIKIPNQYKALIRAIAEAIAKGDQDAILAKLKLALPLIKSEIPQEALEAKIKELVALLPKDLPKKQIENRLLKAVDLLLQKLSKADLEKGLDGLKPLFQKGVDAVEDKIEDLKKGEKKGGEKKEQFVQPEAVEQEEQDGEEN